MTPEERATKKFWDEFFNKGDSKAFDRLAAKDYRYNGKKSDGSGLKALVATWHATLNVNVRIQQMVSGEDRRGNPMVAVYWTSQSRTKTGNDAIPPKHGMNVLIFNQACEVIENWGLRGRL